MTTPFKMLIETPMEQYRADTFWEKEPETLRWIETFDEYDVFYDIGANIGIYSLYCAWLRPEMIIHAMEPDRLNFPHLHQNAINNGFDNLNCHNIALSNYSGIDRFYVQKVETGASGGQIGHSKDEEGRKFDAKESYTVIVCSYYDFLRRFHAEEPDHIKIDVDGQEESIIKAIAYTTTKKPIKSLLVEVNPLSNKDNIINLLEKIGLKPDATLNNLENHSRIRRAKEGIKAENIIFTRG